MLASRFSSVRSPASNLKQKLQKVVRKPTDYVCPFKRQKGAETILLSFKLKAEVILQWFNDFASEFQQEFNKQQAKKSKELQLDSSVHDLQKPCGATYCPLGNESNQPTTDECLTARSSTPENGESEEDATNRTRRKKIDEMRQQLQRWMIYALLNEDHLVDLDTRTRLRNAAHAKMSSQDPEEKCGDEDALSLSFLLTHMMQSMEPSIEPLDTLLEMSQVARGDMGFEQWVKTIVPMERLLRNYGLEFNEDNIQISKSARQHTHTMRIEEGMLWSRLTKRERIWVEENTEDSWNLQEVNGLLQDRDKRNKVEQFYDPVEVKKLDDKYALAMKSRPKHNTLAPTPKDPKPKCSNCHRRHHGKCTKPKADSKKQEKKRQAQPRAKTSQPESSTIHAATARRSTREARIRATVTPLTKSPATRNLHELPRRRNSTLSRQSHGSSKRAVEAVEWRAVYFDSGKRLSDTLNLRQTPRCQRNQCSWHKGRRLRGAEQHPRRNSRGRKRPRCGRHNVQRELRLLRRGQTHGNSVPSHG